MNEQKKHEISAEAKRIVRLQRIHFMIWDGTLDRLEKSKDETICIDTGEYYSAKARDAMENLIDTIAGYVKKKFIDKHPKESQKIFVLPQDTFDDGEVYAQTNVIIRTNLGRLRIKISAPQTSLLDKINIDVSLLIDRPGSSGTPHVVQRKSFSNCDYYIGGILISEMFKLTRNQINQTAHGSEYPDGGIL